MLRSPLRIALVCGALILGGCGGDSEDDLTASPANGSDAGASTPSDGAAAPADERASPSTKQDAGSAPLGPEESGEATYYDPTGNSACGVKGTADSLFAAMNGTQYKKADCGRCVAVTGPIGTTIVPVVDKCPGCDRGDLDLSTKAFAKIAKLSAGRVKITWHFVACP